MLSWQTGSSGIGCFLTVSEQCEILEGVSTLSFQFYRRELMKYMPHLRHIPGTDTQIESKPSQVG